MPSSAKASTGTASTTSSKASTGTPLSWCLHVDTTSDLRVEHGRVYRVTKCNKCKRLIKHKRSRWANRPDRLRVYLVGSSRTKTGWQRRHRLAEADGERRDRYKRRDHGRVYAQGLLEAMQELVYQASRYPQDDDRYWKYAPEARRYRRLMRRWWELPNSAVAGLATPTCNLRLTATGRAEPRRATIPPFTKARVKQAAAKRGAELFRYRLFDVEGG